MRAKAGILLRFVLCRLGGVILPQPVKAMAGNRSTIPVVGYVDIWACPVAADAKKLAIETPSLSLLHIGSVNDSRVLSAVCFIRNPVNRNKSIWLTEEELGRGRQLADRLFGVKTQEVGEAESSTCLFPHYLAGGIYGELTVHCGKNYPTVVQQTVTSNPVTIAQPKTLGESPVTG